MMNVNLLNNVSENRAKDVFDNLIKYTKNNPCLSAYIGGNLFNKNSFCVGMEIECKNKILELGFKVQYLLLTPIISKF